MDPGAPRRRLARPLARLLLVLLGVGLALLVVEVGARAAGVDFARRALERTPIFFRRPDVPLGGGVFRRAGPAEWRGRPLSTVCAALGVDGSAYADEPEVVARYDRDGLRNPDGLTDWDVVVVGDSFVEAGTQRDEDTPTAVLAARLGLVVKSCGVSHTGPRSHARLLRELGRSPRCRDAVLCFYEGNDVRDLLREELCALGLDADLAERAPRPHRSAVSAARLALLRAMRPVRDVADAQVTLGSRDVAVELDLPPPAAADVSPAARAALAAALADFAREARASGMTAWLAYVPVKSRVLVRQGGARRRDGGPLPPDGDLPALVLELAREAGLRPIDPTPAMVEAARAGALIHNPIADCHLTREGARVLGETIAAHLATTR